MTKPIPETTNAAVLRTDFSDEAAWAAICGQIRAPSGDFMATVDCLSDPEFEGLTPSEVPELVRPGSRHTFLFLVDRHTIADPEHGVLVVDLYAEPGRSFRVIPSEMWGVENNLSIANMDFGEFADSVDVDGVFRGFA
ncbi:MAG: DUF6924 domain-containing protein [Gemmatimonadales bacterium]